MMGYGIAAQYPNIHVAAWPYSVGKDEGIWWERFNVLAQPHSAALAHRMGSWVIAPSVFQSSIYNPMGEMVAQVNNRDGNYALAKIDTSAFKEKPLQLADYDADSLKLMLLSYPGGAGSIPEFHEVLEQPRFAK
ncbi:hypothetical protein GA0061100_11381 [Rhizobium hainanense]|uniref:CN hydrolase domain-containing protein n=2 Tax=Rhizobium hainanense TaxID=52131 RepID=A0A1C3W9A7_9HYPH|nr:hypothetical protein GA0061100_11381 [Rhizobium hainanense]